MIACLFVWKDLNLRAEFARFVCNQRTDAIYGGLILRRGFRFDKQLKQ
jgi:hypothetical protein